MWAGQSAGSVTCGCGCVLSWAAPNEVSRIQWHMLECGLPGESAIRARWHVAVRPALSKRIKRRDVVDGIMACWTITDGRIHTAAGDHQSRGWCAPPMVKDADSGCWSPDPAAPAPCFSPITRRSGGDGGAATDSDDDVTDLTSDPTGPPDSPTRTTAAIPTAKCLTDYDVDLNGAEGAADPCFVAVELHCTLRANRLAPLAVVDHEVAAGRSQPCRSGRCTEPVQVLQAHSGTSQARPQLPRSAVDMLASDRRHTKDATAQTAELKADWCRVPRAETAGDEP